jgi:RNA polymerase sigma-70 factor (ECF subfamily)
VAWAEGTPETLTANDDPLEAAQLAVEREGVRAALAQLPEEQKQVLALAYFHGYTQQQIADTLGQPSLPLASLSSLQAVAQALQERG